ncbi:hypothetical protein CHS0354_010708 [Potamilus streckersoni]|uniref:Uncharacterized protein n=1 Tax=Potamilus streckersoni TaxID=2493646 RepID=A0AAE0VZ91_9BIVA|nr:hypothetical protein CHS0354_010708 [Potamilus streckersoni]
MVQLRPSEIRYSQATISTVFDTKSRHPKKPIEDTLIEICDGRQTISNIPSITVCWYKDHWYTTDNRRLWVFKHLEALGKCTTIDVNETERSKVDDRKFNTCNEGISVGFRTPFAPEPSGDWYKKAKSLLIDMNDRLSQSTSKSGKEGDSPECELKTDTSSESDSIISNSQDPGEEFNSDLEYSNSNGSGVGIPKTETQEDSTINICSPDNVDNSSLDPLDECNENTDRKDAINGKLQSDDVPTSNDAETGKIDLSSDGPIAELYREHHSKQNQTEQIGIQQNVNDQFDQDQSPNNEDFVRHKQKSIQDQSLHHQFKVSQKSDRQIEDEEENTKSSSNEGENSLKRLRVVVDEESDYFHNKRKRTEEENGETNEF